MENMDVIYKEVMSVVNAHKRVAKRKIELNQKGYYVSERRCGSGGVGQIIILKNEVRIQIGYGHGKNNYASCVILSK